MRNNLNNIWSFTIMSQDDEVAHVIANFETSDISYKEYIIHPAFKQLPDNPDIHDLYNWLEDRCFPRNRDNMEKHLTNLGLTSYNPLKIVKKTRGIMWEDYIWIRFDGEDVRWDEIKHRD